MIDVEDVIEAGGDQHHSCDAMNDAAHVFAHSEHVGKPGIRELERKAGDDQDDEAGEQDQVLPALVGGHALHHRDACGGGRELCCAR